MTTYIPEDLTNFAKTKNIVGLTAASLKAIQKQKTGYTIEKGKQFLVFQERINQELLKHPVITDNEFTAWFANGEMTKDQLKHFVVQFSVFSNLFLIAQLKKMINADSLETMHASKEILANEIGVVFNPGDQQEKSISDEDVDPDIVSDTGSVEGGTFRFRAAHFEWLLHCGESLDLEFNDLGKRDLGAESTLFFCDELARLYGSENYATSQSASYAVENWAAAGFWKELITGFKQFNEKHNMSIPIGFFTWHDKIEDQHALHTQEELEEYYFERQVDEDSFIKDGNEMMEGIHAFWKGLDEHRKL